MEFPLYYLSNTAVDSKLFSFIIITLIIITTNICTIIYKVLKKHYIKNYYQQKGN
ncbi:hypothetical protein STURON_00836 [Spiroplasma turonicum]|uniref:Uncharacterized protein n=1 Tax=Spiroplasma turonicum TaxID=216946 RepID=A0A0K1P865_9MOLU|nr:hypothetical protein STURON_00836 [Spiroplasma turonicum]